MKPSKLPVDKMHFIILGIGDEEGIQLGDARWFRALEQLRVAREFFKDTPVEAGILTLSLEGEPDIAFYCPHPDDGLNAREFEQGMLKLDKQVLRNKTKIFKW